MFHPIHFPLNHSPNLAKTEPNEHKKPNISELVTYFSACQ